MTNLTYTITHVQVGAEKYWEEVGGFISGDKKSLQLKSYNAFLFELAQFYSKQKYESGSCQQSAIRYEIQSKEKERAEHWLKQNHSHPLSDLANKLGAKVYGGFEDEKDFYLLLPTLFVKWGDRFYSFKYGDVLFRYVSELYEDECPIPDKYNRVNFLFCEESYTDIKDDLNVEQYDFKDNIFHEYARTGIIENDLYKQFFK
jgi:hypothetical protein